MAAVWEFAEWLSGLSPLLQGLFGGAGALLLWEGFLKPRRERRALAHILAEEIALNLEMGAKQSAMFAHNPNSVPGDFRFLTGVYQAVAGRIGELPNDFVGELVLLYAGMEAANRLPESFSTSLERRDEARRTLPDVPAGHPARRSLASLEKDLELHVVTFKQGVAKAVERSNALIPRLRRAAVPRWRLDYHFRRKNFLSPEIVRQQVAAHAASLGLQSQK